ncbi:MAG TPA: TonB-dependent receptor [Blastocatellia bacterium]|nr:TonB-dependent receptor [Blastocatellia bacterium]
MAGRIQKPFFAAPTSLIVIALCLSLAPFTRQTGLAQSTYGSVVGALTDANSAVVPGAQVKLTEIQTNISRETRTRDDGSYEFVNLTQGRYRIEAEKTGFAKFTTRDFELAARQTVRIDGQLSASSVTAEVQVFDAAPLINTENPTIVGAKSNRELQQLPFVFRVESTSPINAIAVLPEVQKGSGSSFSLSGGQSFQQEVSVDGIMTTSVRDNGIGAGGVNVFPSIEAVQEIRVSSINNNAEFSQTGDITTITKPGTNDYHGTGFYNYNGNKLNANPNYFSPNLVRPRRINNNFGGSFAGPLFKNRTFFFSDYERLTIYGNTVRAVTVPEADFRQGNFSRLTTPIIDPSTGAAFAGNTIPAGRINPVSKALLDKYIPAPNDGVNINRFSSTNSTVSNQFDVRVDHNFSERHNIFGRYSWKNLDDLFPATFQSLSPLTRASRSRTLVVADSFSIRPNLLNEFRFGFTQSDFDRSDRVQISGRQFVQDIGIKLASSSLPDVTATSRIAIAGYTAFSANKPEYATQDALQFSNNLTWIKGKHSFKGGVDFRRLNWTSPALFTGVDDFGVFNFNNNLLGGGARHPVANFLLGLPTDVDQTATGPGVDGFTWHSGYFFQDEWRVNPRLTISLGLRYDLYLPFKDRALNITNFLRDTPNGDAVVPNEESLKLAKPAFTASLGAAKLLTADQAGLPEALRFTDKNNFAPRIGIAWRPFGNNSTVLRMGYGIYTTRILGQVFNSLTAIHTSDNVTYTNTFDAATRSYAIVWPNTFTGSANAPTIGVQNFSTANDPNYRDPYTQQWSLTIEREINRRNAIRITYTGSHTVKLTLAPDLNQIKPGFVAWSPSLPRPFPNWSRINTRDNGGDSKYNDLTIQFKGDVQKLGLSYVSSYKWAKGYSNVESNTNGSADFQTEISGRTDSRFDTRYNYGQMQAVPNHRFITTLIWDLPFGRGRAYGKNWHRAADAVLGGWTITNISNFESGQHLTAYFSGHCVSGTRCYGPERVDAVQGQDPNSGPKTLTQWFNTAAFTRANFFNSAGQPIYIGRFGNAEKGNIVGPGAIGIDFGAFKDFGVTEKMKLRLGAQIMNLPNHPNFANPLADLSNANYGRITALNTTNTFGPRVVVLGARVSF